ncbi:MAG: TatD family hydrolase [Bacteroidia bacterium]|nr:TatD family hydrolase [Bacteroidia bacterium]
MSANASSYINIHTHSKPKANTIAVRNAYLKLNIEKIVDLPYMVSVGLHPWHINNYSINKCTDLLLDVANLTNVFAIGEIGIDRAIDIPVSTQLQFFDAQLNIARAVRKPVIIHAVKGYSDVMPYLKKSKVPFIFHGFTGNIQQAKEILKYNAYLSFGKSLLDTKYAEVFAQIPIQNILLETDAANITIEEVYKLAANAKGLSIDELKTIVFNTFAQLNNK